MSEETTGAVADPMERLASSIEGFTERMVERMEAQERSMAERFAALETRIPEPAAVVEERQEDLLPGGQRGVDPSDRMVDQYSAWGYERADFELAKMIQGGAREITKPVTLRFPTEFEDAARAHIFEDPKRPAPKLIRRYDDGRPDDVVRAMDSQETGYGLELIWTAYETQMWEAARNMDTLVGDIQTVNMPAKTLTIPIDGNVPEMLLVSENTGPTDSPYTTSKTPSNNRDLTAPKFTIQQIWSRELEEDSVIAFVPFLRRMINMSAALHLGSAYLNGDTTDAGNGNINLDDANPADTKHYLAFDGLRHYWLVDDTGQGVNQAGALNLANVNVVRGRLNGGDDDIDNALTNINWGLNPRELRMVTDWDTYMAMLDADKVTTVDKYGPGATVLTGELGSYAGIPIISPPYASKTEADGKASTTEASNTKGQITVYAPAGWLGGMRRGVEFFMSRLQGRDQFLFELYTRRGFQRWGNKVAAGIYNIDL